MCGTVSSDAVLMSGPGVRARRRGVAMLLVLGVVAIASVLSWAMLSTASVRAKVEAVSTDGLEAAYQADSGVSYALYYLRYPEKSPVATQQGTYNTFYPGQSGLSMWADAKGATDVTVTNTGDGLFSIRSTSTVAGLRRTTVADAAYTYDRYTVTHALATNGTFTIPSNMKVNGPVVSRGLVVNLFNGISNSPAVTAAGTNVTPTYSELALVDELSASSGSSSNDRPYTFDGLTYYAELAPATITGTLTSSHPATNPKNVWYTRSDTVINNGTINGTLVVLDGKKLTVTGLNTITAQAEMPALIASGTLDLKTSTVGAKLTVNGVAWAGATITDSAIIPASNGYLTITGALLMGGASPSISLTYKSPLTVTYAASAAKLWPMSKVKTVNGVAVRGWRSESN